MSWTKKIYTGAQQKKKYLTCHLQRYNLSAKKEDQYIKETNPYNSM